MKNIIFAIMLSAFAHAAWGQTPAASANPSGSGAAANNLEADNSARNDLILGTNKPKIALNKSSTINKIGNVGSVITSAGSIATSAVAKKDLSSIKSSIDNCRAKLQSLSIEEIDEIVASETADTDGVYMTRE